MFAFEAFTAIALFLFYKPPSFETKHRDDGKTKRQLVAALDYVGVLLFLAACILLLLGLNWVCFLSFSRYEVSANIAHREAVTSHGRVLLL